MSWSIPFSLGDSHQGYRVLGTNSQYFEHFRYSDSQELRFSEGKPFSDVLHAVLGSEVANSLDYELGKEIVLSHGIGNTALLIMKTYRSPCQAFWRPLARPWTGRST